MADNVNISRQVATYNDYSCCDCQQ